MRRQRNTSNAPASPRLVWRYAHPSDPEALGVLWDTDTIAQPAPEVVAALELRAYFRCATCGEDRPTPKGYGTPSYCGGTGYGYTSHDADALPVCYRCCAERDKQSMREDGRATLYLVRVAQEPERTLGSFERAPALRASNWRVQNWPGTLSLPVLSMKRNAHNWRNVSRVDVWFVFDGYVWHGVNLGDSQILRAKRTRTVWRDLGNGRGYGPHTPRKSRAKRAPAEAHN